ncbi:MAG: Coenzyme F420 hydrogenase/dehydrogenase, beta subunit C-terminal domain [Eubacterium sp.]|nr:Coenzyme F420 hydrogenase/dehydrogenase, beta subunit C-terminal domain [Eubacterium sp.]
MDSKKGKATVAVTAASYSGNKGAAAMLQSSIGQLREVYGERLHLYLMSVYPSEDRVQCPHDFVKIVPAQPQRVLFLAFPCAVCWKMLHWCAPVRALLLKNKMLKAYEKTDLVIDEAGIAFSDSRGWILNTYAFVCAAIPMLMGVPVVKYSQALGPFHQGYNRILAKWILPKMKLVVARGRLSYRHLRAAGIRERVVCYADGAFTMPPAPEAEERIKKRCQKAGFSHTAALSVSSVVERRCKKAGIDYCKIMAAFIAYLNKRGFQVCMFANAARIHSKKPRNNDLMTGDKIARAYWEREHGKKGCRGQKEHGKRGLVWEHKEMDAEEIRALIAQCECLVASRFHAMVFALSEQVPVMLIGWSHKYQEVMEQFGLSEYASDYLSLSLSKLEQGFAHFWENRDLIRRSIKENLPAVQKSSEKNIKHIVKILDQILAQKENQNKEQKMMNHVIRLDDPQSYTGKYLLCGMGYACDPGIRKNAASGGMVTALLCSLLQNGEIDGAWVVKTAFAKNGELTYQTEIAATKQQILEASSSVYMKIPMLSHLDQVRSFDGRVAVVLTPCMMRALDVILQKDALLREKIVYKIGLFCSGAHDRRATEYALDKCRIPREGAKRLYYRRGHWRGGSSVVYEDGSEREFSYTKSVCAYKNAYFFIDKGCLRCKDQFAACADVSFGDVWLSELKKKPVKYTGFVVRSEKALQMLKRAHAQGDVCMMPLSGEKLLRSQMRALTFKYRDRRWNHALAGFLAVHNQKFSMEHPKLLKRVPMKAIYYYMCAIRLLLSW